jgi:hypothetical protein
MVRKRLQEATCALVMSWIVEGSMGSMVGLRTGQTHVGLEKTGTKICPRHEVGNTNVGSVAHSVKTRILMGFGLVVSAIAFSRRLTMNCRQERRSARLIALAALLAMAPIEGARAQTAIAPDLGAASGFAALGGAGVTCTSPYPPLPAITVTGDVGSLLAAPSAVTGFPGFTPGALPCSIDGTIHVGDTVAVDAYSDFVAAYDDLAAISCPLANASHNLSGDLRSGSQGSVLEPGIYCISGVGLLTGQLTLNGGSNAVWIFKAESSITPIGGSVVMAGGGNECNVYWRTGTAVDLNASQFAGNILAGSAITFTGVGSSLIGRALADTESVTMTGASIIGCEAQPPQPPSCDTDHRRHKHCKRGKHDRPHCDGDPRGDWHGNGHDRDDDHDGHGHGHDRDDDHDGRGNGRDGRGGRNG